MNYENRLKYIGKLNVNYCFVHNNERHIAILMTWDGQRYVLESAMYLKPDKECQFKNFPYRKPMALLKRIDELLKDAK